MGKNNTYVQKIYKPAVLLKLQASAENHIHLKHMLSAVNGTFIAMLNSSKNLAAMILALVVQVTGFKRCCLKTKKHEGVNRHHYFRNK
jgi:hypothetical protein